MQVSALQRTAFLFQTLIGVMLVWGNQSAIADSAVSSDPQEVLLSALQPSLAPLDFEKLQQGRCADDTLGITETSISQTNLTIPSFWWTRDQIAAQPQFGSRLLDKWLACPGQRTTPGQADFVVNQQVWSLLDYLERYKFVQELGTESSGYGYNMRIFNRQGTLLAAYTCAFQQAVEKASNPQPAACILSLDSSGKAGFRGRPNGIDAGSPTGGGTARP
ncbi:hypothetical protein ACKFKF_19200 [Phormidesmis sp. 146-12]